MRAPRSRTRSASQEDTSIDAPWRWRANVDTRGASILYRDVRQHDDQLNVPRIAVKNNSLRLLSRKITERLDVVGRWQDYRAGADVSFRDRSV
jgi:hypothetical protein